MESDVLTQLAAEAHKSATAAKLPKPRNVAVLGDVTLSRPSNASVYAGRNGTKSIIAIQAEITLPQLGLIVPIAIWSRLAVTPEKTEIITQAGLPKGMKTTSEAMRDRFLGHVELAAASWPGFKAATRSAEDALLGRTSKPTADEPLRPRLVKRVVAGATAEAIG